MKIKCLRFKMLVAIGLLSVSSLGAAANFNLVKTRSVKSATPTTDCFSDSSSIGTVCYDTSDNEQALIQVSLSCEAKPDAPLWLRLGCSIGMPSGPSGIPGYSVEIGNLAALNKVKADLSGLHWMVQVGHCMGSIDGVDNFAALLNKSAVFTCQPDGTFKETR